MITATALIVGAGLALGGVSASPTDTGYLFPLSGGTSGLVMVSQGPAGSELSFNVAGLKPRLKYTMVVSSKRCGANKGTLMKRAFRTDGRGMSWDPVRARVTAPPASVRITRAGKTITCQSRPTVILPMVTTIKVAKPKAVIVVARNASAASIAVSGLQANKQYQFVAAQGGCTPGARGLLVGNFTTDRQGFGVAQLQSAVQPGVGVDAVAVIDRARSKAVFCRTV